jgi:predicted ATPase
MINTNWIVITGPPSSGKTSLINQLEQKGHLVCPEVAREIILYSMHSVDLKHRFARDSLALQREILSITLKREHMLSAEQQIFFDRGTPDSIAYFQLHGFDIEPALKASHFRRYAKVFYCEGLPVVDDGLRLEDDKIAKEIGQKIIDAYTLMKYPLIFLPPVSIDKRLKIILNELNLN